MFSLFAQNMATGSSKTLIDILAGLPYFAWIAFVAIVMGSITAIAKMIIVHRERMEQIRQGHAVPPQEE